MVFFSKLSTLTLIFLVSATISFKQASSQNLLGPDVLLAQLETFPDDGELTSINMQQNHETLKSFLDKNLGYEKTLHAMYQDFMEQENNSPKKSLQPQALVNHIYLDHFYELFLDSTMVNPICPLCSLEVDSTVSLKTIYFHMLIMHCKNVTTCPFNNYGIRPCTYSYANEHLISKGDGLFIPDEILIKMGAQTRRPTHFQRQRPQKTKTNLSTQPATNRQASCSQTLHICPHCTFSSPTKRLLTVHLRTSHRDQMKFQCSACTYATNKKARFDHHTMSHDKTKPYKCHHEGCSFATTQKSNLTAHLQSEKHSQARTNKSLIN